MESIPKIANDEVFFPIENQTDYYLSNYKRVYSMKTKHFMTIYHNSCFLNNKRQKICINTLYDKYFNQPNEEDLIAIIRYNNHKFKDIYYDRMNDKFFIFKNNMYNEIKPHKRNDSKTYAIYIKDINGVFSNLSLNKFKKIHE